MKVRVDPVADDDAVALPPPNGAGACWYWPATPGTKCPGVFTDRAVELLQYLGRLALGM